MHESLLVLEEGVKEHIYIYKGAFNSHLSILPLIYLVFTLCDPSTETTTQPKPHGEGSRPTG